MDTPNAWYLPMIAVGVGFHFAVSWALLWRYFQARERSLLIWGFAWFTLAIHVIGMFLNRMGLGPMAMILRDFSFAVSAIAFCVGQAEREGRTFSPLEPAIGGAIIFVGLATLAGLYAPAAISTACAAVILISLGGAAWLSAPFAAGRRDITHWLLFTGYLVGIAHAITNLLPLPIHHAAQTEIIGHALLSLLLSAAVTWQAWEHELAVRLFSRTLKRLNQPLSTSAALDAALELAAEMLHITHGWILLHEEDDRWSIGAALGFPAWSRQAVGNTEFTISQCACLRPIAQESLVTSIQDVACYRLSKAVGHKAGRHMTIPLGADGKVKGLMVLLVPPNRSFGPADIEMLTAMGEQIGLAIDRARAHDELRAKEAVRGRLMAQLITAQEDERRRIARELHDETGQALTALVVTLDFLVRHPMEPPLLQQRLVSVRDMAETTLAEVRRVIHEMRPTALDDLGLEAALRWLVKRYEASRLKISLDVSDLSTRLPGHLEITVFRLVQEALTNTVKHANAHNLSIRITRRNDRLIVEVADDGKGMGPGAKRNGMGLAGLKERVALVGGSLTITSAPGAGTRLEADIPVASEPPGPDMTGGNADVDSGTDLRRPHDGTPGRTHGTAV